MRHDQVQIVSVPSRNPMIGQTPSFVFSHRSLRFTFYQKPTAKPHVSITSKLDFPLKYEDSREPQVSRFSRPGIPRPHQAWDFPLPRSSARLSCSAAYQTTQGSPRRRTADPSPSFGMTIVF